MKKLISTIVAALVTIAFAAVVFAAEPAPAGLPAGHPPIAKADKKPVKKTKKARKAKKAEKVEQKEAAPTAAPAAK